MQPTSPIAIAPPQLLSPIAATAIYGNCHHDCTVVPPSIAPPPLSPIAILLLPLPSPIVTLSVTHCHHHHQLQSSHHLAINCNVAAVVYCNFSAIEQHCITS
jgi:hypothetical protein